VEAVFEQKLADKSGLSLAEVEALTSKIFDALVETIAEDPDGRARFAKLGAFERRDVPERTYNNVLTDFQDVVKPAHVVVGFTAYKPLRDAVN
jgi:nucleoid DNA-binding protein